MAMDIQDLFDRKLPRALEQRAHEARTINTTYQMNITGAGDWFIDLTSSPPSVTRGKQPAACSLTMSAEDFEKLYQNPTVGMQLYFSGRLHVGGNPMLAMRLQKLFALRG